MSPNQTIFLASQKASNYLSKLRASDAIYAERAALGIPKEPEGQIWRVNRDGILWYREFVKEGGLVLDPAYWILENNAVHLVAVAIETGLTAGADSLRAASRFIFEGPANDVIRTQLAPDDYETVYKLFVAEVNRALLAS